MRQRFHRSMVYAVAYAVKLVSVHNVASCGSRFATLLFAIASFLFLRRRRRLRLVSRDIAELAAGEIANFLNLLRCRLREFAEVGVGKLHYAFELRRLAV